MIPALLTALFFALSTLFAQRSLRAVGMMRANLGRLVVALVVLGIIAHLFGGGMGGAGRDWLLLSGVIGMGLGDLAFFMSLPRIGSRLTVLITQCLAAPVGALCERVWLGTIITGPQLLCGAIILAGVALALMPAKGETSKLHPKASGIVLGLLSATGQGIGAVLSRKANLCAELAGEKIDGFTAAYQRIAGGLLITAAWFIAMHLMERSAGKPRQDAVRPPLKSHGWIVANATCGAILGVSCYQWALFTTPSAIVLPIVACTPLIIIPLTYWFEGERPSRRSLAGGVLAVVGAAGLAVCR